MLQCLEEYEEDLRKDCLFLPRDFILDHNWKACSRWKKLKYLARNKFNLYEAKIRVSVDYREKRIHDHSNED